jgi:hypothetical protein
VTNSAWLEDASAQPIDQRGFMATGEVKVIDNAVVGFVQERGTSRSQRLASLNILTC